MKSRGVLSVAIIPEVIQNGRHRNDVTVPHVRLGIHTMPLSLRFEQALTYACTLHSGQTRKGTDIPYISHLLSVVGLALEHGADEDVAIAAVLHDAVEDAGGKPRLEDIRYRFGTRVAQIVDDCTDAYVTPKPDWRERKETYIAHLTQASPDGLLVSCCDKLHNARSIVSDLREHGEKLWGRFKGGKKGTLWYYQALVAAYKRHGAPLRLANELERTVAQMKELA